MFSWIVCAPPWFGHTGRRTAVILRVTDRFLPSTNVVRLRMTSDLHLSPAVDLHGGTGRLLPLRDDLLLRWGDGAHGGQDQHQGAATAVMRARAISNPSEREALAVNLPARDARVADVLLDRAHHTRRATDEHVTLGEVGHQLPEVLG